ncbi:MAG: NAD(P)H-hydrate epimerase [Gloeomargarita sp. GMQP_bins_120]
MGTYDDTLALGNERFCTQTGLPVPTLSRGQVERWWRLVQQAGLTLEALVETAGRSAAMLTLGWLGENWDTGRVVVLAGSGVTAAVALGAARHMANRGANVRLWPQSLELPIVQTQYRLYRQTGAQVVDASELVGEGAAVVLAGSETPLTAEQQQWIATSGAEVVRIGETLDAVTAAATLVLGLPVAEACYTGQVYLADVGVPLAVYEQVGLYHRFVFGQQYIIPLYPR